MSPLPGATVWFTVWFTVLFTVGFYVFSFQDSIRNSFSMVLDLTSLSPLKGQQESMFPLQLFASPGVKGRCVSFQGFDPGIEVLVGVTEITCDPGIEILTRRTEISRQWQEGIWQGALTLTRLQGIYFGFELKHDALVKKLRSSLTSNLCALTLWGRRVRLKISL